MTFAVGNPISAVMPGDYNYDGLLDLLVITVGTSSGSSSNIGYFFRTQSEPFFGGISFIY